MGNDDEYANGKNAGEFGGSVPDITSSEAMRGYYDAVLPGMAEYMR